MELLLILWLGCGLASATIASGKGRSGCAWFAFGVLLGPIGLMGAAIAPRDDANDVRDGLAQGDLRLCPFCSEAIRTEAKLCRFCRNEVPPAARRTAMETLMGKPKR